MSMSDKSVKNDETVLRDESFFLLDTSHVNVNGSPAVMLILEGVYMRRLPLSIAFP